MYSLFSAGMRPNQGTPFVLSKILRLSSTAAKTTLNLLVDSGPEWAANFTPTLD